MGVQGVVGMSETKREITCPHCGHKGKWKNGDKRGHMVFVCTHCENTREFQEDTLSEEEWKEIACVINELGERCAMLLRRANYKGEGEQDACALQQDIALAVIAIKYVAEFASDKCIFVAPLEVGQ